MLFFFFFGKPQSYKIRVQQTAQGQPQYGNDIGINIDRESVSPKEEASVCKAPLRHARLKPRGGQSSTYGYSHPGLNKKTKQKTSGYKIHRDKLIFIVGHEGKTGVGDMAGN